MNTQNTHFAHILIVAAIAAVTVNVTFADDLNPAPYRGDPLSVYGHWQNIDGTANLTMTEFLFVDDADPTTTLDPLAPTDYVIPTPDHVYEFALPNWIDKMPIKYMRLQLTWIGDSTEPLDIPISGVEGTTGVPGNIVFTSPVVATPVGFYQYYDIEFIPNPDAERWLVILPDTNLLVQAVADTVSTVPEPTSMALLGLGGLLLRKRRS